MKKKPKYLKKKIKSSRTPTSRRYHWMTRGGDGAINDQFGNQSTSAWIQIICVCVSRWMRRKRSRGRRKVKRSAFVICAWETTKKKLKTKKENENVFFVPLWWKHTSLITETATWLDGISSLCRLLLDLLIVPLASPPASMAEPSILVAFQSQPSTERRR